MTTQPTSVVSLADEVLYLENKIQTLAEKLQLDRLQKAPSATRAKAITNTKRKERGNNCSDQQTIHYHRKEIDIKCLVVETCILALDLY